MRKERAIDALTRRRQNFFERTSIKVRMMRPVRMDAYLEEELYDILTYSIQNAYRGNW
jgi:hypothetical protein